MGFRFQRRIRIGKGVFANLSKSGVGLSFGRRGARVSMDPRGKRRASVGIPGTGMSYRTGCTLLYAISAAAFACLLLAGCPPRTQFAGRDAQMMAGAKRIAKLIDEYYSDSSDYPETLEQLRPMLLPTDKWPVNPYNGREIADTGSPKFDAATSVGMVYYQKLYRDDQMVNYQLHVFGEKGKLYIIGNTAIGAKE